MLVYVDKDKLSTMRCNQNISRRKLSSISGLPLNAVYRMETTESRVSSLRLSAVATALGCDVSKLMRK